MANCYAPAALAGLTNLQIMTMFSSGGARTGFGFYILGTAPLHFVDETSFYNLAAAEGFFTGCLPKKYYSPRQLSAITEAQFYALLKEEGITVGDFAGGTICHAPGDADCDILAALSSEGYQTGCPDVIAAADPAFSDFDCEDGRCYGTCCMSPDNGLLSVTVNAATAPVGGDPGTPANWSDWVITSTTLEYICDTVVFLYMQIIKTIDAVAPAANNEAAVAVNGGDLTAPFHKELAGDNGVYTTENGVVTIPANTPTVVELRGRRYAAGAASEYIYKLAWLSFKDGCA